MKKYIIVLMVLFVNVVAFAQQDTTLVYARTSFEKDPVRSKFKKTIVREDNVWMLKLTDKKGVLQELITFEDENLEVRRGPYLRYVDGNLIEEGDYNRGYKVGLWKTYYANKQVESQTNYVWGKLQGSFKRFWENGQLKEQVNFENGKRSGNRILQYSDGKLAAQEFYGVQGLISTSYFDFAGKPTNTPVNFN
jgi:antitoxin component YwqK of YwqJK toxin-antitoxin module